MKVAELIEALSALPPDLEVRAYHSEDGLIGVVGAENVGSDAVLELDW